MELHPKIPKRPKRFFCDDLGLNFLGEEVVTEQQTNTLMFTAGVNTDTRLENLIPVNNSGPIASFLEKKGSGVHHIALQVDDVQAAIAYLLTKNVRMIDNAPRVGAHKTLIAFVHPESTGGVLIELVQES